MYTEIDNLVEQKIEELFALPIGLKVIATFDDMKIYGSDKLNEKFLTGIAKTKFKGTVPILRKAIEKKKFFPGFYTKNMLHLLKNKFLGSDQRGGILGFFALQQNIIVILLDNNTKFGVADDTWMGSLSIHEAMHMFSYNQPSQFFGIFQEDLEKYYYTLFKDIFELKSKPKMMSDIPKQIFYKCEKGRMDHGNRNFIYKWYLGFLNKSIKPFSGLSDPAWENMVTQYILCLKLYWERPGMLFQNIKRFLPILRAIKRSYEIIYGESVKQNFYVQEIGVPSEVIAIRSEMKPDAKTIKAFNQLV